jgi:hypothetical protein
MLYDTPARPWAFGPLLGTDVVARQAEALVQRYDLLEALADGSGMRRDLDPGSLIDPRLSEAMVRQLVPWVDYAPDDAAALDGGWPIPQGVRLETLCYSPWLDPFRAADGSIGGKRVFTLPRSADEFARQFRTRSGIALLLNAEFQDSFHLTPLVVGEVAMDLRKSNPSPRAFRLLMSRHFEQACEEDQRLRDPHPLLVMRGFRAPAIVAFERLAELERIGAIVREVGRHAAAGAKLRTLLESANAPEFIASHSTAPGVAYSQEIAAALASDPALLTLCDYLAVGTDVLASWRNAVTASRGTFHEGFRPAAILAGGSIASDTAAALVWMVDVRTAFISALRTRIPRSRQSALDNDVLFKWYGLTNHHANLVSALMSDFAPERPSGRPKAGTPAKQGADEVRASLAAIANWIGGDGKPSHAGVNAIREGAGLSKFILPSRGTHGSAARADDSLWRARYRDQPFWARFQNPDRTWYAELAMRPSDRLALRQALLDLRRLALGHMPWAPSKLTARVVADLATGVSALSVNPAFARSITRLVRLNRLIAKAEAAWNRLPAGRRRRIEQMRKLGREHALGLREIPGTRSLTVRFGKSRRRRRRR